MLYAFETERKNGQLIVSQIVTEEQAKELVEKHCYARVRGKLYHFNSLEQAESKHQQILQKQIAKSPAIIIAEEKPEVSDFTP